MAEVGPKKQYEYWKTDKGVEKLIAWGKQGLSNRQIAKNMGIHQSTLYKWMLDHQEISDAIKDGKEVIDLEVENALLKRAMGYDSVEEVWRPPYEGATELELVERKVKTLPPDVGALVYWLKNRQKDKWADSPYDDLKKAKLVAETENIKTKTELIKGVAKDTSMLDSLVNVLTNK